MLPTFPHQCGEGIFASGHEAMRRSLQIMGSDIWRKHMPHSIRGLHSILLHELWYEEKLIPLMPHCWWWDDPINHTLLGRIYELKFYFYKWPMQIMFRLQFEPAPRRGEPDVTRRTPDYFLWYASASKTWLTFSSGDGGLVHWLGELFSEFDLFTMVVVVGCHKRKKVTENVKSPGKASFDSIISWNCTEFRHKEAVELEKMYRRCTISSRQCGNLYLFCFSVFIFPIFVFLFCRRIWLFWLWGAMGGGAVEGKMIEYFFWNSYYGVDFIILIFNVSAASVPLFLRTTCLVVGKSDV